MSARRQNEATAVRIDNAATGTTSAPTEVTDPTDGIQTPENKKFRRHAILEVVKGAASGDRTFRVKVHGFRSTRFTQTAQHDGAWETNTLEASSGAWFEIFDSETQDGGANDFNMAFLLEDACAYDRLDTEIVTNGGTTPTLTSAIAFVPRD